MRSPARAHSENEKLLCAKQTQLAIIIQAATIKLFRDLFPIETSMVFQVSKFNTLFHSGRQALSHSASLKSNSHGYNNFM
jgi:hypothetical protein